MKGDERREPGRSEKRSGSAGGDPLRSGSGGARPGAGPERAARPFETARAAAVPPDRPCRPESSYLRPVRADRARREAIVRLPRRGPAAARHRLAGGVRAVPVASNRGPAAPGRPLRGAAHQPVRGVARRGPETATLPGALSRRDQRLALARGARGSADRRRSSDADLWGLWAGGASRYARG